jgi:hypothetical protein
MEEDEEIVYVERDTNFRERMLKEEIERVNLLFPYLIEF